MGYTRKAIKTLARITISPIPGKRVGPELMKSQSKKERIAAAAETTPADSTSLPGTHSTTEELTRLVALRDAGVLSEVEFEQAAAPLKAELLRTSAPAPPAPALRGLDRAARVLGIAKDRQR